MIKRLFLLPLAVLAFTALFGGTAWAQTTPTATCYYGMKTCSAVGDTAIGLINQGRAATNLSPDTITYTQVIAMSPAEAVNTQVSLTRDVRGLPSLTPSTRFNILVSAAAAAGTDPTCGAVASVVTDCQELWGGSGADPATSIAGVAMMVYDDHSQYNLTCLHTNICTGHRDSILYAAPAGDVGYIDTVCDGPGSGLTAQGSCSSVIWWTQPVVVTAPAPAPASPAVNTTTTPAPSSPTAPTTTTPAPTPVSPPTPAPSAASTQPSPTSTPAVAPSSSVTRHAIAPAWRSLYIPANQLSASHDSIPPPSIPLETSILQWMTFGHALLAVVLVIMAGLAVSAVTLFVMRT